MKSMNCTKAIEIGVFTGSSALVIAQGINDNGKLIAIDVDKKYTDIAKKMWKKAGVDHKIELYLNGGIKKLEQLNKDKNEKETYDFAYIDAIKTEYIDYYEKLLPLMKSGGILAFDNVLRHGKVPDHNNTEEEIKYLRKFNEMIKNDERVEMCLITLADGVLFATKQ